MKSLAPAHADRSAVPFLPQTGQGSDVPGLLAVLVANLERALAGLPDFSEVRKFVLEAQTAAARLAVACRVSSLTGREEPFNHSAHKDADNPLQGTILIADDHACVCNIARRFLESQGLRVLIATDGLQAVSLYRAHADELSLVLIDLSMPELDGLSALEEMRRIRPDVRAVLMSGFNVEEAAREFQGSGLVGYLQKPFRLEVLHNLVRRVLAPVG